MAILSPLDIEAEIVFLGLNPDRKAGPECRAVETAALELTGLQGDAHRGENRPACVRMRHQYPKGAPIRNARQLTIVSQEEMEEIGDRMGLEEALPPAWIGANVMLCGLPRVSHLPPGTRLIFESGAGLVVDLENEPCSIVARVIEKHRPGLGLSFPKHGRGRRGVTAWVERSGELSLGMRCKPHIPPQRIWPG